MKKSVASIISSENNEMPITTKDVESRMIVLRKQSVLLDADVAELYGVETKRVNEAVRNNPDKFPSGYLFELDRYEKDDLVENFDRLKQLKFSTVNPTAFTERGLYMLATILKSARAVNTTLAIVDTFVRTRELARTMVQLQNVQDGGEPHILLHRTETVLSEIIGRNLQIHPPVRVFAPFLGRTLAISPRSVQPAEVSTQCLLVRVTKWAFSCYGGARFGQNTLVLPTSVT